MFDNPIYFKNTDYINFTFSPDYDPTASLKQCNLLFKNSNGQQKFSIDLDSGSSCSVGSINHTNCCFDARFQNNNASKKTINFSISEVKNLCVGQINGTDSYNDISQVKISCASGANFGKVYIDDFSIDTEPNQLPYFNFSITNVTCLNSTLTGNAINYTLDVDAYDLEGNTIYYALTADNEDLYLGIDFQSQLSSYQCRPFSFFGQFDLPTFGGIFQICDLNHQITSVDLEFNTPQQVILTNRSQQCEILSDYTEYYISSIIDKTGFYREMLFLNPNCNQNKEFITDLYSELGLLEDFNFIQEIYWTALNKTGYNITIYESVQPKSIIAQYHLIQENSTSIAVYYVNTTGKFYDFSVINTGSKIGLNTFAQITISYDYSLNSLNLSFSNNAGNFTGSQYSGYSAGSKLSRYAGIIPNQKTTDFVYVNAYLYGGKVLSPQFTTTIPVIASVRGTRNVPITLYITDDIHLNKDFNYETVYVDVPYCDYYIEPITDTLNPVELFTTLLGGPLQQYLRAVGVYELGKTVLYWLFIFMFIGLTYSVYKVTHMVNFTVPMIGSSFSCFIIAWLSGYTVNMIVFLLTLAFGIAIPVVNYLSGGRYG